MQVVVKLFGSVREAVGEKELRVEIEADATLGQLRDVLDAEHRAFEERFLAEARAAARLSHPNIASKNARAFFTSVTGIST